MSLSLQKIASRLESPDYKISEVGLRYGSLIYFLFGKTGLHGRKHVKSGEAELDIGSARWELRSSDGQCVAQSSTIDRILVESKISPPMTGATVSSIKFLNKTFTLVFSNRWTLSVFAMDEMEEEVVTFLFKDLGFVQLFVDGSIVNIEENH